MIRPVCRKMTRRKESALFLSGLMLFLCTLSCASTFDPLAEADSRIAKYRMREVTIRLRDRHHAPLAHLPVKAQMTRHQFLFGCNLYNFGKFPTPEQNQAYLELWSALFNYATLPFYFASYSEEPADFRQVGGAFSQQKAELKQMTQWCLDHKIVMKGHPLIWHEVWGNPKWLPSEPLEVEAIQQHRIETLLADFPEINYWDLLNEPTTAWKETTPIAGWMNQLGPVEATKRAENWFSSARPPARFLINDYNVWKYFGVFFCLTKPGQAIKHLLSPTQHYPFSFLAYLEELKRQGLMPDAIGIQSHMHMGQWPLFAVRRLCEDYSRLGVPIHFTELTVLSGRTRRLIHYYAPEKNRNWASTRHGELDQAEYVEKFYTLLFSHPQVEGITWWDFSDYDAWLAAPAGLVRADLTPKPAYQVLHHLLREKWWTNFAGETDSGGAFRFRGFCGDYELSLPPPHPSLPFRIDCQQPEHQLIELTIE